MSHTKSIFPKLTIGFFGLLLTVFFVVAASPIGTINQGDYSRTTSGLIQHAPLGLPNQPWPSPMRWQFVQGSLQHDYYSGSTSFIFYVAAIAQKHTIGYFDMHLVGGFSRTFLCMILFALSFLISRKLDFGLAGICAGFVVLLIACFSSHNIMFLQSLYGEFSVILGLPLLVIAIISPPGLWRSALLLFSLIICGAAKVQFFYLPALVFVVSLLPSRWRSLDVGFFVAIAIAQAVCLVPFSKYEYTDVNRHHSIYLGSYMVMTDDELDRIGAAPDERVCIGVDAWGSRLDSVDAARISRSDVQCNALEKKNLVDTVRPYLMFPSLMPRLIVASMPTHFTVLYFHLDDRVRYLASVGEDHLGSGLLRMASRVRDRLIGPWVAVAICVLAWIAPLGPLSSACRLLSLFAISQVPVVLVGEGVRDLSKHLAGAQYALDLLMAILLIWVLYVIAQRLRSVRNRQISDNDRRPLSPSPLTS